MGKDREEILAIIPAFNEQEKIGQVVKNIKEAENKIDILVIDDGSTDSTAYQSGLAGAKVIRLSSNMGYGVALQTGYKYAFERGYDFVVQLDGDGQHDPAEIHRFVARAERVGADIVVGCRMGNVGSMPVVRKWTNLLTSAILSRLAHARIRDSQSGYRLIRVRVLRSVSLVSQNYDLESEILVRAARKGFRISEVPVRTIYTGSPSSIHPGISAAANWNEGRVNRP